MENTAPIPCASCTRQAVLDIGSNSVKLLVADVLDGVVHPVLEASEPSRLAAGIDSSGIISDASLERALQSLETLCCRARNSDATEIAAVGTSALRSARNSGTFTELLRSRLGLQLHIISGDEEARHIYRGVCSVPHLAHDPLLVMDLGGGSSEWIAGSGGEIQDQLSLDIGCVRTTEAFIRSYPPAPHEIAALRSYLTETTRPVLERFSAQGRKFVGTGGSFCCIAASMLPDFWERCTRGEDCSLPTEKIAEIAQTLTGMTLAELQHKSGIPAKRADIIVAAAWTVVHLLESLGVGTVHLSTRNLRFGWLSARR